MVSASVTGMAVATIPDSRRPSVNQMRTATETMAIIMWRRSSFDLSPALRPGRPPPEEDVVRGFFRPVRSLRHVPEIHGLPARGPHHDPSYILGGAKKRPGLHQELPIHGGQAPRREVPAA